MGNSALFRLLALAPVRTDAGRRPHIFGASAELLGDGESGYLASVARGSTVSSNSVGSLQRSSIGNEPIGLSGSGRILLTVPAISPDGR